MKLQVALLTCSALAFGCAPGRTTFAQYPGAPAAFDKSQSSPQAIEVADKVFAAAGGPGNWVKAKQIRWSQITTAPDGSVVNKIDQAWDRWNARHWAKSYRQNDSFVIAIHELYGEYFAAYSESRNGIKTIYEAGDRAREVQVAHEAWQVDSTVMCLPFLLQEPGAILVYGTVKQGETEYHDLKLTFADADKPRAGLVFHAIVDKDKNELVRVEIEKPSTGERIGFELSEWVTAGGLKFPATRKNIGSGELLAAKDIRVGDVDDSLYIAPLK